MSTAEESPDQGAALVLVVDDDPEILKMLAMRLRKSSFRVVTAIDGQDALDKAREVRPDVVVLDVMMPKMNGWEVARAMRQEESLRDVKIIMLTAIGPNVNEMTSPLYGADTHLDKPFDFKELESCIHKMLSSGSATS